MRRPGTTLMEVMVASGIMLMVISMVFVVYVTGARAWRRGEGQADLLQDLEVIQTQLQREVASSVSLSLSADAPGKSLSFLSARLPGGGFQVVDGHVEWQSYLVYYLDPPTRELRRREIPLVAGAPQRQTPGPIDAYDDGSGARPLSSYCVGGDVIGRDVSDLTFAVMNGGRLLKVTVEATRKRPDNPGLERIALPTTMEFKN